MDETPAYPELSQAEQVPAIPPLRKRQIDSDDDDDAEPRTNRARTTRPTSKPVRLTRKNLALFDKMGKHNKKTSKVPTAASNFPSTSGSSSSIKTLSTTAPGFAKQAYKNGILPPLNSKPPANLQEIRERLVKPRATASPPESVYESYVRTVEMVPNEATMVFKTGGRLLKEYDNEGYNQALNQAFTGFPADVGFNNGLSAPQPDFVEGLQKREYAPFPVDDISGAVPSDNSYPLTLPHLAGEWKGPGGDMREATLQSGYDGAALVYARNQALAFQGKPDPADHATVTTFTTNGNQVNFYAHYATKTENGTLEYHQFRIKSTNLVNSYGDYKDGRKSLRNAQDYAKTQSEELRDQLKEYWKQQRDNLPTIAAPLPPPNHEPPISTDADDHEIVEQPYQLIPAASTGPHKSGSHSHSSSKSHSQASKSHSTEWRHSHSTQGKRKASSSQSSHGSSGHVSKHRRYWKKDPATGRYYHKHSHGTVSWLDDEEEDERD